MNKNVSKIGSEGPIYIARKYPFTNNHVCRDMPLCLTNYYLITYYYDYYLLLLHKLYKGWTFHQN